MNQHILLPFPNSISVSIKREDLVHPFVSGNKFRKLKYNLLQAKKESQNRLLTFGGAFSNHIAAVAFIGKENNYQTIGIIRGEELSTKIAENPTLQFAQECGMHLEFVTREAYRQKNDISFLDHLKNKFDDFYHIPEGGTNDLAIQGCEEILTSEDANFDFICCAIGTGGTISGLINSALSHQKVLGFPALKGDFLQDEIRIFAKKNNWEIQSDYHFGGYGKVCPELIHFINDFYSKTAIPLDPIYTSKMVFGVMDLIQKKYFQENSKILLIHTGGIQGVSGMNLKLAAKNLPTIQF